MRTAEYLFVTALGIALAVLFVLPAINAAADALERGATEIANVNAAASAS